MRSTIGVGTRSLAMCDSRRPRQTEVLINQRQIRAVVPVRRHLVSPAGEHVLHFAGESRLFGGVVFQAARGRLMVLEHRVWGPDVSVPGCLNPKAEVDVVEGDAELFVEAFHGIPGRALDRQAGPGDCTEFLMQLSATEVSGCV